MDLSFNLAPSYRDLKDPTSRQNFEDTPGQIPKLILTLRHIEGYGLLRQLLCGGFTICGVLQSIHKLGTRVAQPNNPNDKPTQIIFKIIGSLFLRL